MEVWRVVGSGLSWDEEGYRWGGDLRLGCTSWPTSGCARWLWSGWSGSGMRGFVLGKLG